MKIKKKDDTLFLIPETDLIASKIEKLRDYFIEQLKQHSDVSTIVLQADNIEIVDSLGVNLIIGIYRQVSSESRVFKITGAGKTFLKIAGFFQLPNLFTITAGEESP